MPHIYDQNDPIVLCVIPCLMFKIIIENHAAAFLPPPDILTYSNCAIPLRNRYSQMTAQPHIRRTSVRANMSPGAQTRKIHQSCDCPHSRIIIDSVHYDRAGITIFIAPVAAFIEKQHIPATGPLYAIVRLLEPGGIQRQKL